MKIFLVSDAAQFALTDVYYGYIHAFETLGIDYTAYPLHHYLKHHREHICYSVIHSEALLKSNGYTHIIFIGGLNIPPKIMESFHKVLKVIIIATEDPHTFDPLKNQIHNFDYYFSNERALTQLGYKNLHYLPTAGNPQVCGVIPPHTLEEKYKSDILFLGAMYPNRKRMLEGLIPLVKDKGLNLKVLGHPQYLDKKSPIWNYIPEDNFDENESIRTIPHEETIKYYNGAKIVLNFFRDVKWNPTTNDKSNPFNSEEIVAESLNPRAYEVPLCGSFMLMEDTRAEAREVYSEKEVGFFSNTRQLRSSITKFLIKPESNKLRQSMSQKAYIKATSSHTYIDRARKMIKILEDKNGT